MRCRLLTGHYSGFFIHRRILSSNMMPQNDIIHTCYLHPTCSRQEGRLGTLSSKVWLKHSSPALYMDTLIYLDEEFTMKSAKCNIVQ